MAKKKKEKKCHFPTDPRYGVRINPTPNDLQALGDRQMLNSRLLDCLLQRSAPPPHEDTPFQVFLGSLETRSYLESCNALVHVARESVKPSNWNRIQAKIKGIQSTFADLFSDINDDDATKTLVIPIVNAVHFFVLVVEFNFACRELFLRFKYYDSLRRSSRGGPGVIQGTPAFLIVREVRDFFFNFVLHGKNKLNHITLPSDDNLIRLDIIGFHQCIMASTVDYSVLLLSFICLISSLSLKTPSIKIGSPFQPQE